MVLSEQKEEENVTVVMTYAQVDEARVRHRNNNISGGLGG